MSTQQTAAELPDISRPDIGVEQLAADLDAAIEHGIRTQPRSLQRRIGPSEMGIPCDLRIAYRLLGTPECNPTAGRLPWKPFVGTAVHAALQVLLEAAGTRDPLYDLAGPRYLIEHRVPIAQVGGEDIDGSCDLYDRVSCTVLDWKIIGGSQLRRYKADGPGEQYRTQVHLYGYGWRRRGYPVRHVAIYFLPRDQEWRQRHIWSEPYDEQIALGAITRVQGIAALTSALGAGALPLMRRRQAWCQFCPWHKPGATDLPDGCPGDPDALKEAASAQFSDLIA